MAYVWYNYTDLLDFVKIFMKYLSYFKSRVFYVRLVGLVLFLVGLLGFAFRSNDSLPGLYLLVALMLGFWGLVLGASRRPDGMSRETYGRGKVKKV